VSLETDSYTRRRALLSALPLSLSLSLFSFFFLPASLSLSLSLSRAPSHHVALRSSSVAGCIGFPSSLGEATFISLYRLLRMVR